MTLEQTDLKRLTKAIEEATQVGHVLWQTIEELRTDLVHELRNHIDRPQESKEAEIVSCAGGCDASVDSLSEAVIAGWSRLTHDPEGLSWSWIGVCADCRAQETASDAKAAEQSVELAVTAPKKPGTLFSLEE